MSSTAFSYPEAEKSLKCHYQLSTLDGLGLQEVPLALRAAGGLLAYLKETKPLKHEKSKGKNPIKKHVY